MKYAISHRLSLEIPKLDMDSLPVVEFSDASFANNDDFTLQRGHICFLRDASGRVVPICFKSYKSKCVTSSVMAGEAIAFNDLFDIAVTLASELNDILPHPVPTQLFTDSKSLFDVIYKDSITPKNRMMLDIAAAREGFRDNLFQILVSSAAPIRSRMD